MKSSSWPVSALLPAFGLTLGLTAHAGSITWSDDAMFTQTLTKLTGTGSFGNVDNTPRPMLSSIGPNGEALDEFSGMEYDGGSFTYTSSANDVETGVVLYWQAGRNFSATSGTYVLESVLQGSSEEPAAGLITKISLSTIVFSQGAGSSSEAIAKFGPQTGTDNSFSSIVVGTAYEYPSDTDDELFMTGEIDIKPTAADQVFTFNFSVAVGSQIAPVLTPEPSAVFLLCAGIGLCYWKLRRKSMPRRSGHYISA